MSLINFNNKIFPAFPHAHTHAHAFISLWKKLIKNRFTLAFDSIFIIQIIFKKNHHHVGVGVRGEEREGIESEN